MPEKKEPKIFRAYVEHSRGMFVKPQNAANPLGTDKGPARKDLGQIEAPDSAVNPISKNPPPPPQQNPASTDEGEK